MPKQVRVYRDSVFYPEGPLTDLYVADNKRSKSRWRISPRRATEGNLDVTAPRVCNLHCVATSVSTGRRCGRRTCMDYRYCPTHLATIKHLLIARSRRLSELGHPGLGLYAYNPRLGRLVKDGNGLPVADATQAVFEADDEVGDYGGERLTREQFDARYEDPDDRETATYAAGADRRGFVMDGLAAATAVSYSNESLDIADIYARSRNPRSFNSTYSAAARRDPRSNAEIRPKGDTVAMYATKRIHQGEEILWNYTSTYWSSSGMKKLITDRDWD